MKWNALLQIEILSCLEKNILKGSSTYAVSLKKGCSNNGVSKKRFYCKRDKTKITKIPEKDF